MNDDVILSSELAIIKSDGYDLNASVLRHRDWFVVKNVISFEH